MTNIRYTMDLEFIGHENKNLKCNVRVPIKNA